MNGTPRCIRLAAGRIPLGRLAAAALLVAIVAAGLHRAGAIRALPDYMREVEPLVDVPGASSSVGAVLHNPAAPRAQRQMGYFFGWVDDPRRGGEPKPWMAAVTRNNVSFSFRRFQWEADGQKQRVDELKLGLAAGTRSRSIGLAYAWNREHGPAAERHRYLQIGAIRRWRVTSLGMTGAFDLQRRDNYAQADIGVRPFGPRLTFFADGVYRHGQSVEDMEFGVGVDAVPVEGVRLAAKVRDDGSFGARLELSLTGTLRAGARTLFDDGGEHTATAYVLESGSWRPPLGYGRIARQRGFRKLSLRGPMTYQTYRLFDERRTLLGTLHTLNRYADDPGVAGVVVDLSGARLGGELAWEVRAQLAGLRARGKRVIVYADRLGMYGLMLASVADQIWMDPQGALVIRGLTIGRTYYADLFAKAGVGFEELRYFTYKSAAEVGARRGMSAADREQRQALVDDVYETVAALITTSRGLAREDWDRWVDERGELEAVAARAVGLIDSTGTYQEALAAAERAPRRGGDDVSQTPLAGVTGDVGQAVRQWGEPERIELLYAIGACAMESGIRGPELAAQVKRAREDDRVRAVVFRVDSPGGERLPSELVTRELIATAAVKPVVVSQGSVAASGGYWLSMEADTILTSPITRTGSIGVISAVAWDDGLGERTGLSYDHVQRGAHADYRSGWRLPLVPAVLPHRPLTVEERERAEELIRTQYAEFVERVAAARGRTAADIESLAQGRVWSGARALELGLVDRIGGLWDALRIAKQMSGLPPDRPIAIHQGPSPGWVKLDRPAWLDPLLTDNAAGYLRTLLTSPGRPLLLADPIEVAERLTWP